MLSFDFSDFVRGARHIEGASRQIPFVTAYALTKAMQDAQAVEYAKMQAVFDRPTRYTLNSLYVVRAEKHNLRAELRFKEGFGGTPAWKYLGPQVRGGGRRHKGFERALMSAGILKGGEYVVPGSGVKLDGHGNIPGGVITRILSALGANRDPSQNTTRRPKRSNRKRNLDYFVLRGTKAPDGVYLRVGRTASPILIFVKAPAYSPRFPYYQTGRQVIPPAFRRHFHAGWERFVVRELKRAA